MLVAVAEGVCVCVCVCLCGHAHVEIRLVSPQPMGPRILLSPAGSLPEWVPCSKFWLW